MIDLVTEVIKRPGCRLIRLEGGDSFKIPYALFMSSPLKAGDSIDLETYRLALGGIENRVALAQAARMLEMGDQSVAGLAEKLSGYGYSQTAAHYVVSHLKEAGYLDDRRYAEGLIRLYSQKYGSFRIRQELARKGIQSELTHELIAKQDGGQTLQTALKLAQKTMHGKPGDPKVMARKVYTALARRGFPPDVINKALSQAEAPEDTENDVPGND
jgi:regulatory protein